MTKYFNTGIEGKNTIEARLEYDKYAKGYAVHFSVGDREDGDLFGWHIDADYFNFYQKPQTRLLIPCGRRSDKKMQEAMQIFNENALDLVRDFAAASEALGAPHMEISAAA